MTLDPENIVESMIQSLGRISYIKTDEMPNIDLYVDQVTTFLEKRLANTKRNKEDKIMTKTMINNYAKNDLLPPPDKKKYSKDHMMMLIFIYYYKNILSINDINKLLGPLKEHYFQKDGELTLEEIYNSVFKNALENQVGDLQKFVEATSANVEKIVEEEFEDTNAFDKQYLQFFSFIGILSFDVYVKKMMIEKLIDLMPDNNKKKK